MFRGRPKGVKDNPDKPRRTLRYFKKYNPRRNYGRPKGSPNKSERWSFYLWRKGAKLLDEPESLQMWKKYYEWLLACVNGRRGRKFRSGQSLYIDELLQEYLIGEKELYRYYANGRDYVTPEEGFAYVRELKKLRFKRRLYILRKIRRLEKAIEAQEQINQGSFGQDTNK